MKTKNLISAALLVFVAASVVVLVVKQARQPPPSGSTPGQSAQAGNVSGSDQQSVPVAGKRVIAYYLHGNFRCPTCTNMERYAHEAVQTGFGERLNSGRLQWQVVNYEEPGKEHFATDFQLVAPSLVLVLMDGNEQIRWENLPEIWELEGNKPAFIQYVQEHVQTFLKET